MTPTPIYKDGKGWRELNPFQLEVPTYDKHGRVDGGYIDDDYIDFEQSITYHPFPNEPNVNPGEVVMAYLKWQCQESMDKDEWSEISEGLTSDDYMPGYTRQIWVAANQPNQEGKEEQAKEFEDDPRICATFNHNTQFEKFSLYNDKTPVVASNNTEQYPPAPKVEVSAEQSAHNYALDYYHESDHEFEIVKDAHLAGQALKTSSLQQENDKLRDEIIDEFDYETTYTKHDIIRILNALNKQ